MSVNNDYYEDIVAVFGQYWSENGKNWAKLSTLFYESKFDDKSLALLMKQGRDTGDINLVSLPNLISKLTKEQKSELEKKALEHAAAHFK